MTNTYPCNPRHPRSIFCPGRACAVMFKELTGMLPGRRSVLIVLFPRNESALLDHPRAEHNIRWLRVLNYRPPGRYCNRCQTLSGIPHLDRLESALQLTSVQAKKSAKQRAGTTLPFVRGRHATVSYGPLARTSLRIGGSVANLAEH